MDGFIKGGITSTLETAASFRRLVRPNGDAELRDLMLPTDEHASMPPIPAFTRHGDLPPGIHETDVQGLVERYATTRYRRRLLEELGEVFHRLHAAGVTDAYIGGSFITAKRRPGDIDLAVAKRAWVGFRGPDPHVVVLDHAGFDQALRGSRGVHVYNLGTPVINAEEWLEARPPTFGEFYQHDEDGNEIGLLHVQLRAPTDDEALARLARLNSNVVIVPRDGPRFRVAAPTRDEIAAYIPPRGWPVPSDVITIRDDRS